MKTPHPQPTHELPRRQFLTCAGMVAAAWSTGAHRGWATASPALQSATNRDSTMKLWDDKPATTWMTEAYPIGNGPLGAMLFGGSDISRIQFNEISLWSGDRMAKHDPKMDKKMTETAQDMGAYQAFGDVLVHLGHDPTKVRNYRRELDISRAVHQVSYEFESIHYKHTAFISHADGVLVMHLQADKPQAFSGRIHLTDMHQAVISAEGSRLRSVGQMKNGFAYEAQLLVVPVGGKLRQGTNGGATANPWEIVTPDACLDVEMCDGLTLILAAGTNFVQNHQVEWIGTHPHATVTSRVDAAAKLSFGKLLERHQQDYRSLFDRFSLHLGDTDPALLSKTTLSRLNAYQQGAHDPNLESLVCQFGRYLLISCSRPGALPANLQGVWNDRNQPPWSGDYHSNINFQMNYWLAEPANLTECHRPMIDYIDSIREVSQTNTRHAFGKVRGWTVQTMNNSCGVGFFIWNTVGSAWYAQHLWEHFAFGRDENYLRETAYPIMKEICHFWIDRLKQREDGTLVAPDGWSPEHGPREDGISYDQQIIHDLFTNTIDAADALQVDKPFRDQITDMRSRLLGPKIGRWGQLQEWESDKDDPKDTHRHVSHLFALHPGRQISMEKTPDLAEAARISLNARGDESTGWSRAWKTNFWARLWDGDRAYRMIRKFINIVNETGVIYGERGAGVYSNLFCSHPPFQIDGNLGIVAGFCEMLVQSHTGSIRLLPALSKAWPSGSVTGLRARGGFILDLTWNDHKLTKAVVHSTAGLPCTITYRDQSQNVQIAKGTMTTLDF